MGRDAGQKNSNFTSQGGSVSEKPSYERKAVIESGKTKWAGGKRVTLDIDVEQVDQPVTV